MREVTSWLPKDRKDRVHFHLSKTEEQEQFAILVFISAAVTDRAGSFLRTV